MHVHCIYNARVSAFFFRYATETGAIAEQVTFAMMDGIWRPGGLWAGFIGRKDEIGKPNQYADYDY